ncbi:MAG TPA: hypothetical protein VH370_09355 [Humisphaera sp.]|jgi:hypothetical protein|nr:hypothetical protein [Humisphaera sp.]
MLGKQEFEDAALKFELEKLRITADREVRVQAAVAMGNMLAKAQMQICGDPETMAKMAGQFMRAASIGTAADGLLKTLPPQGQELLQQISAALASQFSAADAQKPGLTTASEPVAASAGNGAPRA